MVYQQTVGLTSTRRQKEVNDLPVSLEMMYGQDVESPSCFWSFITHRLHVLDEISPSAGIEPVLLIPV